MSFGRTLIQIRERSFLDLLDMTLVVLRRRPLTLGLAALAGIAPLAAANAWLLSMLADDAPKPLVLLWLILVEAPWATAPLTVVLGGLMFGDRPSTRRVLRDLFRGFVPMFLYQGLLRGLLCIFWVLVPLIPARLAFLDEVILLERGRWASALARSATLCSDRGGELFARWLVQLLYGSLFVACFWWASGRVYEVLIDRWTWEEPAWADALGVRFQVGVWVAVAFFSVVRFLTYIDQRIRLEGWEVELRLRAAGAAMEDRERW